MERIITRKKRVIKFTNTKAIRVGKGIKLLRERFNLSPKQLAEKTRVTENYLNLVEEGHEPEIERGILETIAQAVGFGKRGNAFTDEQLVNLFLYASTCEPPRLSF